MANKSFPDYTISVCIISIIRLVILFENTDSQDPSKDVLSTVIWSSVELNLALICCTLPVLKPLYVKIILSLDTRRPKLVPPEAVVTIGGRGERPPVLLHDELTTCNGDGPGKTNSLQQLPATMITDVPLSVNDEEQGINARDIK